VTRRDRSPPAGAVIDEAATVIASDSKRAPHEEQKRAPWPDAAPHLEQDTAGHCNG